MTDIAPTTAGPDRTPPTIELCTFAADMRVSVRQLRRRCRQLNIPVVKLGHNVANWRLWTADAARLLAESTKPAIKEEWRKRPHASNFNGANT